jgi:putative sigma-54 modulation protein
MKIEYTGRQTEVPAAFRSLAEKKLRKLSTLLHGLTNVHVILSVDKHRHIVEVTASSPHLTLTAVEESGDLESSLVTVADKLTRQAQKHMGKLRTRKRQGARRTHAWSSTLAPHSGEEGESHRIVHSQRFVAKPMTVDEAVLAVESDPDGLVVYRDSESERINVLFRRRDGQLGIIEPEG